MPNLLYKLTFANGKLYIGQTVTSMQTRATAHKTAAARGSALPVHAAWRKHGAPLVEVVAELGSTEALHAAEVTMIAALGTQVPDARGGRGENDRRQHWQEA